MTLLDLLGSGECHEVNNHMVRIVSGYEGAEPVHDPEVLQQALENLRQFEFVGIAERMDESAAMIARRLGGTGPRPFLVSTRVPTVSLTRRTTAPWPPF